VVQLGGGSEFSYDLTSLVKLVFALFFAKSKG